MEFLIGTAARLYTPCLWSPDISLIELTHNGKWTQAVYLRHAYARSRCLHSEATIEDGVRQSLNHPTRHGDFGGESHGNGLTNSAARASHSRHFVFQAHRWFFFFFSCLLSALRWAVVCFGEDGRERFRFDDSMSLSSPASANCR